MNRAEQFIRDYTRNCSNELDMPDFENGIKRLKEYQPWLTPDLARKAVEIAREEVTERALMTFQIVCNRPAKLLPNCETYCSACKQFKQAIKDE